MTTPELVALLEQHFPTADFLIESEILVKRAAHRMDVSMKLHLWTHHRTRILEGRGPWEIWRQLQEPTHISFDEEVVAVDASSLSRREHA